MDIELEVVSGTPIYIFLLFLIVACVFLWWVFKQLAPPSLYGTLMFLSGPIGKELPQPTPLRGRGRKSIGSGPQCDIVICDDSVSEEHAKIYAGNQRKVYIRALNGKVIIKDALEGREEDIYAAGCQLQRGMVFRLGEYDIQWA